MFDYDKKVLLQSGIYSIQNILIDREYIGKTRSTFKRRWGLHINALNRGECPCIPLQQDWFLYRSEAFVFRILEIYPPHSIGDWYLWREAVCMQEARWLYNLSRPSRSVLSGNALTKPLSDYKGQIIRPALSIDDLNKLVVKAPSND